MRARSSRFSKIKLKVGNCFSPLLFSQPEIGCREIFLRGIDHNVLSQLLPFSILLEFARKVNLRVFVFSFSKSNGCFQFSLFSVCLPDRSGEKKWLEIYLSELVWLWRTCTRFFYQFHYLLNHFKLYFFGIKIIIFAKTTQRRKYKLNKNWQKITLNHTVLHKLLNWLQQVFFGQLRVHIWSHTMHILLIYVPLTWR